MIANLTCPMCGHTSSFPEQMPGQEVRCPACFLAFPTTGGQASAPAAGPNRTILAQSEPMIRYNCPRCKKSLESPASFAGQKLNCPDCNQRLQIPQPPAPPAAPPVNKTILATMDAPAAAASQAGVAAPHAFPQAPLPPEPPVAAPEPPSQVESCLECGVGLANRARVQSCPDCTAQLCSAKCYREHRYHAHDKRRKSRPRNVECDRCGTSARPYISTAISDGGWITFVILLIVCFPLFWIGLLMTETRVICADCGARLD